MGLAPALLKTGMHSHHSSGAWHRRHRHGHSHLQRQATVAFRQARSTLLPAVAAFVTAAAAVLKRFAYEGYDRDQWQRPSEVLDALELAPGQTVVDLGAGTGYFTFRLARRVGPTGRVIAVDVDEGLLRWLGEQRQWEDVSNVDTVAATAEHVPLEPASVDLVFLSNVYHHLTNRPAYFRALRAALKPGGRIAVVEHDGREGWFPRVFGHATPRGVMRDDLQAAGFEVVAEHDRLPRQSFMVFTPRLS